MVCGSGKTPLSQPEGFADEVEDFLATFARFGRAFVNSGKAVAELAHGFLELGDVFFHGGHFDLIGFGVNKDEWDAVFDEPGGEFEVDFLRGESGIDEDKHAAQVLAHGEVVRDKFVKFPALLAGGFGVSVAGEVNERPFFVDEEEVDHACASRFAGDGGEVFDLGESIDE